MPVGEPALATRHRESGGAFDDDPGLPAAAPKRIVDDVLDAGLLLGKKAYGR
ncbi:hypothetical protein [Streptomyces bikiniensis]|uniref:hypothetical protein n=1 Tax=Streptomyces bikiniensis TaxID=1896 RepID=UPI000B021A99|nr:hypothetical protein [Streptomyces bikiniensis]